MPRVALTSRAYQERSPIAGGMESINLYAESNGDDPGAPVPVTFYPTPGTVNFGAVDVVDQAKCRCTYRTSVGTAYTVIGSKVYSVQVNGGLIFIGNVADRPSQVYMADNGLAVVLVDGAQGWAIDIATNNFGEIVDAAFYGADFVVFLDTFFVFNRPHTNQFYISLSNTSFAMLTGGTAFDPLDIAAKSGSADPIVAIVTYQKMLWLIGALTTEIWQGTGAADFYFQLLQGAYIDHGCVAPYTAANTDVIAIWLMQDRTGKNMVVMTEGTNTVKDIGTPFLTNEFNNYFDSTDAIGCFYQQDDHAFYVLIFPTANKTWAYELKTKQWHRWSWLNVITGNNDRHRINCCMFFNGKNIIGDWETGSLYVLDGNTYTDVSTDPANPTPIRRVKTFIHMLDNLDRVMFNYFDADMQVGTQDPVIETDPKVLLDWSDNRGISYGFPVEQSMGKGGQFNTIISWNRLGYARDRIFRLSWSEPIKTALNGAFVGVRKART